MSPIEKVIGISSLQYKSIYDFIQLLDHSTMTKKIHCVEFAFSGWRKKQGDED